MAATVSSAWSKPGAWALDSEEHEAELLQQNNNNPNDKPLADFPSLAAAAATKPKKKKAQTYSLAEFTAKPDSAFADQDPVVLPTGPRQRTAEELDRTRLGGGFRNYGDRPNRNNSSGGDESSNSRWGSSRVSDEPRRNGFGARDSNRELPPSRADETDNWAAAKKPSGGFERRERDKGGFFDSQSRADESDSWVSNKSFVPSEGRRFGSNGGGFERERRVVGFGSSGGADSDNWNTKKGESNVGSESVGGRPKLVLQPRTVSVSDEGADGNNAGKPKGVNPFGEARPREQVLAEKGQDWKKIDEQLESVKIKEASGGDGFGKRGFGSSNGGGGRATLPESRTERSWRKPQFDDDRPKSAEKVEDEPDQKKEVEDEHVEKN
ncbi:eukaryotic translation initiation factor 4B3-like [Glycine soja]|uniref:Eukaryotic translation initiation factor 4B3 n=1 Tax=Glycine soja TaxID=3848 RepID=A0A445HJT5_GLYSO|nr:eukaryotic translation initiation factor 4B3-like [Glycine soja]RZB74016.1 Eukaryotic translation initiation factor 4B3 [Glycine soja]